MIYVRHETSQPVVPVVMGDGCRVRAVGLEFLGENGVCHPDGDSGEAEDERMPISEVESEHRGDG